MLFTVSYCVCDFEFKAQGCALFSLNAYIDPQTMARNYKI